MAEQAARKRTSPRQAIGEILYGMFLYDSVRMFRRQEAHLEHLFILISFGDLLGVPILPP